MNDNKKILESIADLYPDFEWVATDKDGTVSIYSGANRRPWINSVISVGWSYDGGFLSFERVGSYTSDRWEDSIRNLNDYRGSANTKTITPEISDSGEHYRFEYKGIKLDPYRIADIYVITDHAVFSALKKLLVAGDRGGKDYKKDIVEARDALNRKIEMMGEDAQ